MKAGRSLVLFYVQLAYSVPSTQELLNKYIVNEFTECMYFLSPSRLVIARVGLKETNYCVEVFVHSISLRLDSPEMDLGQDLYASG